MERGPTSNQTINGTEAALNLGTLSDSSGSDVTFSNDTRLIAGTTGVYKLGGFICHYSASSQRAQAAAEVYINGSGDGVLRGSSYIRNSGASWDYYVIELAPVPLNLTANDYVELYVGTTTTTGYAFGNNGTATIQGAGRSKIYLERVK